MSKSQKQLPNLTKKSRNRFHIYAYTVTVSH